MLNWDAIKLTISQEMAKRAVGWVAALLLLLWHALLSIRIEFNACHSRDEHHFWSRWSACLRVEIKRLTPCMGMGALLNCQCGLEQKPCNVWISRGAPASCPESTVTPLVHPLVSF